MEKRVNKMDVIIDAHFARYEIMTTFGQLSSFFTAWTTINITIILTICLMEALTTFEHLQHFFSSSCTVAISGRSCLSNLCSS